VRLLSRIIAGLVPVRMSLEEGSQQRRVTVGTMHVAQWNARCLAARPHQRACVCPEVNRPSV
jgi:hypothetical protein